MPKYDNSVIPGGKVKLEDPCKRCKGKGRIMRRQWKNGRISIHQIECPRCLGEGKRGYAK
jgi:DnaJ-class molecular chaperone